MKQTLGDIVDGKPDVTKFGEDSYWKERYDKDVATFEWFVNLTDCCQQSPMLKSLLMSRVKQKASVLEIGCGTSTLCESLWDLGFRDIHAIDKQKKAVDACIARQGTGNRGIKYSVGDMTKMDFSDASFDLVIDKGALDSLVCQGGDAIVKAAAEIFRVLKPAETSLLIAFSNAPLMEIPDGLKPYFERIEMWLAKNSELGVHMAKAYIFKRRKKPLQ